MEELHELIRTGSSYSELVAWLQKRQKYQYLEACSQINAELKRYRLLHQAPTPATDVSSSQ